MSAITSTEANTANDAISEINVPEANVNDAISENVNDANANEVTPVDIARPVIIHDIPIHDGNYKCLLDFIKYMKKLLADTYLKDHCPKEDNKGIRLFQQNPNTKDWFTSTINYNLHTYAKQQNIPDDIKSIPQTEELLKFKLDALYQLECHIKFGLEHYHIVNFWRKNKADTTKWELNGELSKYFVMTSCPTKVK